jgi:hypothetical protein
VDFLGNRRDISGGGLVAGTLMSIDFPESQWRFSRLTVTG